MLNREADEKLDVCRNDGNVLLIFSNDALIVLLGLRREKLRIGYSYDATVSNARPGARASHEVSLSFELRKRIPKKSIRAIRCPEF